MSKKFVFMEKIMLQVKKFSGSYKEIVALSDVYMRSYNELSTGYKSADEMALYTKGTFIRKLKNWSNNMKNGDENLIFVLYNDDKPCGIMRLNPIPEAYRQIDDKLQAAEYEHGVLDGRTITRNRKIQYSEKPQFDDNALILNQIYLAPESQKKGWGTYFIKNVFSELVEQKYNQFIVEYNDNNANGKKFHEDVLCAKKIAHTTDFDHITASDDKQDFCLSPVSIGISSFTAVLQNIATKEKSFTHKITGR